MKSDTPNRIEVSVKNERRVEKLFLFSGWLLPADHVQEVPGQGFPRGGRDGFQALLKTGEGRDNWAHHGRHPSRLGSDRVQRDILGLGIQQPEV
jgi:hypothetical protein